MTNKTTHDKKLVNNMILRWILISCGWISLASGLVGIFLPIVPTVPFLLLAVACFSKSSDRFHSWLVEHDHLGPLIREYLQGTGIPLRAKISAIGMVWVSFPASAFLFAQTFWLRALLLATATAITLYLFFLPTRPRK